MRRFTFWRLVFHLVQIKISQCGEKKTPKYNPEIIFLSFYAAYVKLMFVQAFIFPTGLVLMWHERLQNGGDPVFV